LYNCIGSRKRYQYKPLDLLKNEIRILKILDSTALQRPDLVHCSLHHVSLDDLQPRFRAFKDKLEGVFKQPIKAEYVTKSWVLQDSELLPPEFATVGEQDLDMSDNMGSHTQPSIAHWRYEASNLEEARKPMVETIRVDSLVRPRKPHPKFQKRRSETISPHLSKSQTTFKIKPRFTWGDYEAISYCWESDIREKEVIVDGMLVRVPKNLELLLRKLRHLPEASSGMGFWVDGLCIDQDNTLEKNHQVRLMQRIYSQSFATVVWLGSSVEGSNQAMDLMAEISEITAEDEYEMSLELWLRTLPWEKVYAVLTRSYWKRMWIIQELALNTHMTLFLCGERQLPRSAILLTCLFCYNRYAGAISAALAKKRNDDSTRPSAPEYDTWQTAYNLFNLLQLNGDGLAYQKPRIETVLDLARKANVKDPRDKVYGMLGLLPPALSVKIQPNYSLSKEQVYIQFATALLESSKSLDETLSWCAYVPDDSFTSRVSELLKSFTSSIVDWSGIYASLSTHLAEDKLPSWVPDWTKPFTRRHVQWLRKSLTPDDTTRPYTTIGHELRCRGVCVDSIQSTSFSPAQSHPYKTVSSTHLSSSTQNPTYSRYKDIHGLSSALERTLLMSHPRSTNSSILDVYWIDWEDVSALNKFADTQTAAFWTQAMAAITRKDPDTTFNPWESFDRFRHRNADFSLFGCAFKSFFPNMRSYKIPSPIHAAERDSQNLTTRHARNIKIAAIGLEGRRLVTTRTGFLGLAPEETQIGDTLAVLIGCAFPVILRPFGTGFRYIGECYVDGLVYEEVVAGLEGGESRVIDVRIQ
jgi:hypothetical protein